MRSLGTSLVDILLSALSSLCIQCLQQPAQVPSPVQCTMPHDSTEPWQITQGTGKLYSPYVQSTALASDARLFYEILGFTCKYS